MTTSASVFKRFAVVLSAAGLLMSGCGEDSSGPRSDGNSEERPAEPDRPTVVATTSVLADVVENLGGDQFAVVSIMPPGADPHTFEPSARQVAQMAEADAMIVNGEGLEEGLLDVIESTRDDGVPTFEAISAVTTIEFGEGGRAHAGKNGDEDHGDDDHGDEDHGDEDHGDDDHGHDHDDDGHGDDDHGDKDSGDKDHGDDDDGHGHGDDDDGHDHAHEGVDPHFFLDPARMATAAEGVGAFLAENVEGVDADALDESVSAYVAELEDLDAEVEELLSAIDEDRRVLVTNHDVLGYFADRYGFEVVGTVIPSGATGDGASAGDLQDLAALVADEGVPAIFVDSSAPGGLAETIADEVDGDIAVVTLFTESLGETDSEAETYVDMVRINAERIADALA